MRSKMDGLFAVMMMDAPLGERKEQLKIPQRKSMEAELTRQLDYMLIGPDGNHCPEHEKKNSGGFRLKQNVRSRYGTKWLLVPSRDQKMVFLLAGEMERVMQVAQPVRIQPSLKKWAEAPLRR